MNEYALREVVADAIERGIRQQESGWDACETCLGRVADVVLAGLDIQECCVVCGLTEANCEGQDHGEYEHDYEALLYLPRRDEAGQ